MNGDACLPDKSQLARDILTYLLEHPDAQDTLEGIAQGWLPGRGKKYKQLVVQEVVKDLVLEGTLVESKVPGSPAVYRFNLGRRDRMKELLKKK